MGNDLLLISVVVPVYRPNIQFLREAVESVKRQWYGNWELCLWDDGSDDPALRAELEAASREDPRIRFRSHATNSGISAATNAAASLASGTIFLFLDQDDLLAPDCLGEFAEWFARHPDASLAYSDNDKIGLDGSRINPSFKPDFSPFLLLSHMYLVHAMAVRRELFETLGGFRSAFDGSQDFDFALRATELCGTVGHIPKVLYHWRMSAGSTALNASEKSGGVAAGLGAVSAAARRRGYAVQVVRPAWAERAGIGLFSLVFPTPACQISILIIDRGEVAVEPLWLQSVFSRMPAGTQVVYCSSKADAVCMALPEVDCVCLSIAPGATLAQVFRAAVAVAAGDVVVLVEAAVRPLTDGWVNHLCGLAMLPRVGVVAPRLVNSQDRVLTAGLGIGPEDEELKPLFFGLHRSQNGWQYGARVTRDVFAVSGNVLAFAKTRRDQISDIDDAVDDFLELGCAISDVVRGSGLACLACNEVDFVGSGIWPERLDRRYGRASVRDPWLNPNLEVSSGNMRVRPVCPALPGDVTYRLAVVTHNLDEEGAQRTLMDLLAGLAQRRTTDLLVISSREGALAPTVTGLGGKLVILPQPTRRARVADRVRYGQQLKALYRDFGADAVLANTLDSFPAVNAAHEEELGAVWWQHEGGRWDRFIRTLPIASAAAAYAALSQSYRVVQVAEATCRAWRPAALRSNFQVVRHGIPPAQVASALGRWSRSLARAALGVDESDVCVLLVGSVSARKGQADIVRAVARLSGALWATVRVMIVGAHVDAAYLAEMQRLIAALPVELRSRLHIPGKVEDVTQYYAAADIFVCCSRQESAPRSILEAMLFSLPVLTTPVDGIPEMVDCGRTGLFFAPGAVGDLVARLAELFASRDLRERLGRAGRVLAEDINDYGGMVDRFDTLLRQAAWSSGARFSQSS